ncbi:uncharacterized protein LOC132708784 isoform X2 [Cylas formicarius]|uniref:uncharacterized protein LOC132708784 isoform X2 n=1 Tax=Cylas formicarius TaxID=197179 RepID=UPI002958AE6B|nr:uncharacterized protein LOC132708784 isoform X2 [Cylas formicarius]
MFGSKLRAWMDAVRPKKKQQRKDKQGKCLITVSNGSNLTSHTVKWESNCLSSVNGEDDAAPPKIKHAKNYKVYCKRDGANTQFPRYSTTNLSSPESAYSTGYSTDGTSPGAPPDYLLNGPKTQAVANTLTSNGNPQNACSSINDKYIPQQPATKATDVEEKDTSLQSSTIFYGKITEGTVSGIVSPRQRNRIRTNPWLPGGTSNGTSTPVPSRQELKRTPVVFRSYQDSSIQHRYLSPAVHRRSLSSSSCSSLSATNIAFDHHVPRSLSDEDDCTLNEMMGKYDESYVYEKETDILSDSNPTDCESDIDTGQDGGDEDDMAEAELDFIDNDSQRRRSSRKRNVRRFKDSNSQRHRPIPNKRCLRHSERLKHSSFHQNGSKSAGATPVSVRRSSFRPEPSKSAQDECLKKRSNSVCLQRDTTQLIDKRDMEADLKYRELIGQAEQIIRTMNINGLSPRRLPGPANKRVELLKSAECAKAEVHFKSKPVDDTLNTNLAINKVPSNAKTNRFSPKKNHITNFIINNSPGSVRKELQGQTPLIPRRNLPEEIHQSPLVKKKFNDNGLMVTKKTMKEHRHFAYTSPIGPRKCHQPRSILLKNDNMSSPRHKRANMAATLESSSSDDEEFHTARKKLSKSCPQSEPMRRKVYFGCSAVNFTKHHGKTVVFNLNSEAVSVVKNKLGSTENLRHQVLLNTIQNLKRNLEDQSASLQQTYRSTQNMYKY